MTLELIDGHMGYAGRAKAQIKRWAKEEGTFNLPIWLDREGSIHIGLPVENPQYNGDMMQVVVSPEQLFSAIGRAYEHKVT
jgi:hypothetical protein